MKTVEKALEFENRKFSFKTTSDRILAAREAKDLILEVNELYKKEKDAKLMDIMKRLTVIKQKIEKRLKGRPLTATS
ncbi:hypothetical protein [Winogradskyella wichelsiae]|uniref:hypothetical protein n=1 Tax=Winogradskyella wichelsiae TaxID=2697007 RepID=UPI0015CBF8F9|nr:hypothetical protein [Winogradskyella wichelsiae]